MTCSTRAPNWRRFLQTHAPFLFKRCRGGNYHWRWDRLCFCSANLIIEDLKTGAFYRYDAPF